MRHHVSTFAWLLMMAALFQSGCAHPQVHTAEESAAEPPSTWDNIAVRQFLGPQDKPDENYGAYGYVLLTERPEDGPGNAQRNRCIATAKAFYYLMEDVGHFDHIPSKNLMVTYWATTGELDEGATAGEMVDYYDHPRMSPLLHRVLAMPEVRSDTRGPLLVAWAGGHSDQVLVWDLRTFPDRHLVFAFREWRQRICRDPENWHDGFDLMRIKSEIRNGLNNYGQAISDIIMSKLPWSS